VIPPIFDDVKKGERHLRREATMCFYILGCVFVYLDILWTCVSVFYGHVLLLTYGLFV